MTNLVTSTAPGVYLIHEKGQRPVEGVAVWEYLGGIWRCQRCSPKRRWAIYDMDCEHIRLAKQHAQENGQ